MPKKTCMPRILWWLRSEQSRCKPERIPDGIHVALTSSERQFLVNDVPVRSSHCTSMPRTCWLQYAGATALFQPVCFCCHIAVSQTIEKDYPILFFITVLAVIVHQFVHLYVLYCVRCTELISIVNSLYLFHILFFYHFPFFSLITLQTIPCMKWIVILRLKYVIWLRNRRRCRGEKATEKIPYEHKQCE